MTFADPKIDFAFKKIFGDKKKKHILISFLNAVLEKNIVDVEILDPYQAPKLASLKHTILDVKAKDEYGNHFIVEMQANPYAFFDKRALDYMSRAYAGQLDRGQDYSKHRPVYFIGVLGFSFFKSTKFLSKHLILNMETNQQEIRDFELYFIELPKFKKKINQLDGILEKWTFFIKHARKWAKVPDILDKEPAIRDAALTANYATWTKEEIEVYEYWEREENAQLALVQQLEEAEKARVESEKARVESEKARVESETNELKLKKQMIHLLKEMGKSTAEIAAAVSISEEELSKLLTKF